MPIRVAGINFDTECVRDDARNGRRKGAQEISELKRKKPFELVRR
jgi:hypothetical protein